MKKVGYFSFEGFENELGEEIRFYTGKQATHMGRLFLLDEDRELTWAQLTLRDIEIHDVQSISKAAKLLRDNGRRWASYAFHLHRRSQLIQEQVRAPKIQPLSFLEKPEKITWGFWTLLSENQMLVSPNTGNYFPLGLVNFAEDRSGPPSRAYLKLWETFTLYQPPPARDEKVLDLGSCPGGWTWVLQRLGTQVISVDKAPLDPSVASLANIEFVKRDAFKLRPDEIEQPAWLFSDIICEPQRLYELVARWLEAYPDLKCICTIKYKGKTDFKTTELFRKIPGSRIIHLCHNKHEVTWIKT